MADLKLDCLAFWGSSYDIVTDESDNNVRLGLAGATPVNFPTRVLTGGKPDQYLQFNGSNQALAAQFSANKLLFTDGLGNDLPFSISLWVNPALANVGQHFISKRNLATQSEWAININSANALRLVLFSNNGGTLENNIPNFTTTYLNQWTHVAVTYDGSKDNSGMTFYINGVLTPSVSANTGSYTGMPSTNGVGIHIGALRDTANSYTGWFSGGLDSICAFSKVLDQDNVNELYNGGNGFNPFPTNLRTPCLAFYSFDKNFTNDDTNRGHILTYVTATAPQLVYTGGGKPDSYATFTTDNFAVFSGVTNTPQTLDFNFGATGATEFPFSVALWIRPTLTFLGTNRCVLAKWSVPLSLREWGLFVDANNNLIFQMSNNNTGDNNVLRILVPNFILTYLNEWKHIVFTYNGSKTPAGVKMYLDGVLFATGTQVGNYNVGMIPTTVPFSIGQYGGNDAQFTGQLDSVGIWSGELTQDNVNSLYNDGEGFNPFVVDRPLTEGWYFWYGFDDFGNREKDDSDGNTPRPLINSGTTLVPYVSTDGRPNGYINWTGNTNDRVLVSGGTNINQGQGTANPDLPFSLSLWAKFNNLSTQQFIISKRTQDPPGRAEWQLHLFPPNHLRFTIFGNNAATITLNGNVNITQLNTTNWFHFIFNYDGSKTKEGITGFFNGQPIVLVLNSANTYVSNPITNADIWLGFLKTSGSTNFNFSGQTDGVGLRSGVCTKEDAMRLYNGGLGLNPFTARNMFNLRGFGYGI